LPLATSLATIDDCARTFNPERPHAPLPGHPPTSESKMDEQASFCRADRPDAVRLVVAGEIDLGVAGVFASNVKDLLGAGRNSAVIDLQSVTFFNSTGIGVLCDAAETARRREIALVVVPSDHVRRTLEITGLTETFDLR
jgi:anti-anti-sigma factor